MKSSTVKSNYYLYMLCMRVSEIFVHNLLLLLLIHFYCRRNVMEAVKRRKETRGQVRVKILSLQLVKRSRTCLEMTTMKRKVTG